MARSKATVPYYVYPVPIRRSRRVAQTSDRLEKRSRHEDPQVDSPLYNKLSTEVRMMIFELVLLIHNDSYFFDTQPSNNSSLPQHGRQVYRPMARTRGYNQEALAILQTCQVIHREARHLAVPINTHVLLYPPSQVVSFPIPTQAKAYFSRMASEQIEQIKYLHLFVGAGRFNTYHDPEQDVGGYRSDTPFAELGLIRNGHPKFPCKPIRPSKMTITVRDNEWGWSRFRHDPGSFHIRFLQNQKWDNVFEGLQCLVMELEIQSRDKRKLYQTVEELIAFKFDVGAGKRLVSTQTMDERTWKRPLPEGDKDRSQTGQQSSVSASASASASVSKLVDVTVFTIVWRLVDSHT